MGQLRLPHTFLHKEMIVVPDDLEDFITTIPERITGGTQVYNTEVAEGEILRLRIAGGEVFFAIQPEQGKKLVVQVTTYVEQVDA